MSDLGERGIGLAAVASLLGLQPSFLSVQSLYSNPEKNLKASFYHITLLLKNLWLSTAVGTQSKSSYTLHPKTGLSRLSHLVTDPNVAPSESSSRAFVPGMLFLHSL